ncbi:hypothetical protein PRIPAC_76896 [Pristionchus pacificus]|uniref:Protein kinase domain-containing protein n=1 Tax=Pristionchus pacificus TaxID=54126 RepID=A0A8R1V5S1_PRIPA|nr:hypothetical protein PRIPAC_76896 [Pristionchus pacificus]
MEVRSREEDSEFVRVVRVKITEETRRCGHMEAVFWLESTVPAGWLTLDQYLTSYGPFPIDSYFAASIIQQVASSLLFLHQFKMAYGSLTGQSILLDMNGAVHVLPSTDHLRHSLQDDIRALGKLMLRLVTGQSEYPPPNALFPVNRSMFKLVGLMLDTPMTAGQIRYHPTLINLLLEKPTMFFFNQELAPPTLVPIID